MSIYLSTWSFDYAENTLLARKGGEVIGRFQKQLEDFIEPLYPIIEGFHDLKFRFQQWDQALL